MALASVMRVPPWAGKLAWLAMVAVFLAAPLLILTGLWLSTAPEPRLVVGLAEEGRVPGRWGTLLATACWAGVHGATWIHVRLGEVWWLVACAVSGLALWGLTGWYAHFGRRMSDAYAPKLLRRARLFGCIALTLVALPIADSLWRAMQPTVGGGLTLPVGLVQNVKAFGSVAVFIAVFPLARLLDRTTACVLGAQAQHASRGAASTRETGC